MKIKYTVIFGINGLRSLNKERKKKVFFFQLVRFQNIFDFLEK